MSRQLGCHAALLMLTAAGLAAQPGPRDRVKVLIGFNKQPGANEQALVRAFGGTVKHTYRLIPAIAATLPQSAIAALSNNPAVSTVEPDVTIYALGPDEYDNAWGVKKINARTVHEGGNRGMGVKICILDSGIDRDHPDLYLSYAGGYDFHNADDDPSDDNGHGTHVAGTIAAMANGVGVIGVAPQARILAYKVLGADGTGDFSSVIAAVQRCMADGGMITNNSYGSAQDPGGWVQSAFDKAAAAGILHVGAAGNSGGCSGVSYPAAYESVIAVGATESRDRAASFSCRGPKVELSAPGVNIQSTYPDNSYATVSGTSMATPHVSGLAALVFACGLADLTGDGKANAADVRLRMQQTALDLGTSGRDEAFGFGRIQADLAVRNCGGAPPATIPPDAPTGLAVVGVTRNSVTLGWNDTANESNFVVERCTGASCTDFSGVAIVTKDTTSYTSSGLRRSTTYRFRVQATNSAGTAVSTIIPATTAK